MVELPNLMNTPDDRNRQAGTYSLPTRSKIRLLTCPLCGKQERFFESRRLRRVRLAVEQIIEEREWDWAEASLHLEEIQEELLRRGVYKKRVIIGVVSRILKEPFELCHRCRMASKTHQNATDLPFLCRLNRHSQQARKLK